MELPPAVHPPQIGDHAATDIDQRYRRYCDWCTSLGIPLTEAAPLDRYSKNGGVGSRGGTLLE